MASLDFDTISSLQPSGKINWKIYVRVSRMWQQVNQENGEVVGINFIVVDAENNRLHAWSPSTVDNFFVQFIQEGETVSIHNFRVKIYENSAKNICFKKDTYITFITPTVILPHDFLPIELPLHVFNFTNLENVQQCVEHELYLIDVAGVVTNIQSQRRFINRHNEEDSMINFVLTQNNKSVYVAFRREFGESFINQVNNAIPQPVVVIIASCKVNFVEDVIYLTNFPATRFYINPVHDAAVNLRNEI